MSEWNNYGDLNFTEYGGVMVRKRDGEYDIFQLQIDDNSGDKYAYYNTIVDGVEDFADKLNDIASDFGYDSGETFAKADPERAIVELIENQLSYGIMEFGVPLNANNQYSSDYNDFIVENNDLIEFMKRIEIPEGFIPEYEFNFNEAEIVSTEYERNGFEATLTAKIEFPYLSESQQMRLEYEALSRNDMVMRELQVDGYEINSFEDFKTLHENGDVQIDVEMNVVSYYDCDEEYKMGDNEVQVTVAYDDKKREFELSLRSDEQSSLDEGKLQETFDIKFEENKESSQEKE